MKPRQVYMAADPINAEIAKDMLISYGIEAHVRSQHLWGGMGELPATMYPTVWIDDGDHFERARRLLAAFEQGPVDADSPWQCPHCSEWLDGQFLQCWNCQTRRPNA